MKICKRKDCEKTFKDGSHNRIYCSPECRKIVSDAKILKRYHNLKEEKPTPGRKCKICLSLLSQYNRKIICSSCDYRATNEGLTEVLKDFL